MNATSSASDRRAEPRRAADAHALILGDGPPLAGRIVDLSDGGLRLRLDRSVGLPPVVIVIDVKAGTACEGEVAWAKGQEVGLKCRVRATSLQGLVPARFIAARDAWKRATAAD